MPKCVQSDVQNNGMTKTFRRTAPSVHVKVLYNIMCLQVKEKVLLYTQNCVTIGTINIKNFPHIRPNSQGRAGTRKN